MSHGKNKPDWLSGIIPSMVAGWLQFVHGWLDGFGWAGLFVGSRRYGAPTQIFAEDEPAIGQIIRIRLNK
jgi:hypothetical protein